MPDEADLALAGGSVLTVDPAEPEVEAVAVSEGRVTARGRAADVLVRVGEETTILELDGGLAVPGFVDAHTHPVDAGVHLDRLDLSGAGTREAALQLVRDEAAATPEGEWILAYGWDGSDWPSGEALDRASLDAAAPDHPVLAERVDRHQGAANTRALEALDVDPEGHPEGALVEEVLFAALEAVGPDEAGRVGALERFADHAHAQGVTSVHAMVPARDLQALAAAREQDRLGLRVRAYLLAEDLEALPDAAPPPDPWLRLQGVKAFADGSIGARTAALHEPYADAQDGSDGPDAYEGSDERGTLLREPGELEGILREAKDRDLQPAVHAIGDRAIDTVLDALAGADVPPGLRPRIEHAELLPGDGLRRFREQGVVASCQPNFVGRWAGPGGLYEQRLGQERAARADPFRRILDADIPLAFGSDHMPFGPLTGLAAAADPPREDQRLEPHEALGAYTRGAAEAVGDAPAIGVLEVGSRADVAVLSEDPREVGFDEVEVDLTLVDGEVVHDARGTG